jgi:hypothetical protein
MRKNLLIAASCIVLGGALITGCSKDDTSAPVISLNGSSSVTSVLNTAYTDPGATATDDEDGAITVTSSGTVNKDKVGTYVITYSAIDKAGNQASATRSVRVYNEGETFAGTYNVVDSIVGTALVYPYTQTISVDSTVNKKIHFNKFGNYANNTGITATSSGTTFDLPFQTATNIGSGSGTCDVGDHTFQGVANTFGTITNGFRFQYVDAVINGGSCNGSVTVNSNWVKQ